MSVNEEFLRELCENYAADWEFINQTTHPDDTQEAKEEAERSFQAILQHFQQEQEKPKKTLAEAMDDTEFMDGVVKKWAKTMDEKKAHYSKVAKAKQAGEKLYTQSEVDRLIREARIGEYKAILGVDFDKFYPEDKFKDFISLPSDWINQQISEINMDVTTVTEELSKQQEGSK